MIIEAITAYTAVKMTWETLEILHLLHVGHETGKHGYKAGSFITNALQQRLQEIEYENNPLLKFVRESKTDYDFHAAGNLDAIEKHNQQAQKYLNSLNKSLGILNSAKNYFLETHRSLERMVNALNAKDAQTFLSQLSNFKINFKSFKDEYKRFSLKIEPPNRESLYIAYISKGTNSIEKFNAYLESIDEFFKELKETKEKISVLFENDFRVTPAASDEENLSFEFVFELKQRIRKCMNEPELIEETIQKILPESSELAGLCTEIAQISTAFKKIDNTYNEQTNLWSDDPNWLPMLTKKEQIENGQRIFLHAMSVKESNEDEKLLIAQIFLRKFVSNHMVKQMEVDELAYEMAGSLRIWQIKKCKQLIRFLITLEQRQPMPDQDMDGLLAWLKTKRTKQNPIELLTEILVSPCLFSNCNLESAQTKLNSLFPDQDLEELIEKHQNSLWGSIWEKSDLLIQLPKSFKTKILKEDCQKEDSSLQRPTIVSAMMRKLGTALIGDLKQLQIELMEGKFSYLNEQARACSEKIEAFDIQKRKEHDGGVQRIKQAKARITIISSFANSLFPYLYKTKKITQEEQKLRVPTIDDLSHIIYSGVDPNGICLWKENSNTFSKSNQLVHHFLPDQAKDSKTKAWLYARDECQVNRAALFSDLFSSTDHLILSQVVKNNLSIQAILKDSTLR